MTTQINLGPEGAEAARAEYTQVRCIFLSATVVIVQKARIENVRRFPFMHGVCLTRAAVFRGDADVAGG